MSELYVKQVTEGEGGSDYYIVFEQGNFSHPILVLTDFEARWFLEQLTRAMRDD
jgi:hypothetical protein